MSLWEKSSWAEKVAYRSSSILQRSSVSFFGSSGISSSCWWFTEVVGVITHVAEETKIGVGWVKVKKLPILRIGKWKSVLIEFCWKNSTLFGIYVHFALSLKIVRQEHLKIFLDVSLGFFSFVVEWCMFVRLCFEKAVFVIRRLFVYEVNFSDVWSEYYCLARGNHFCSQSFGMRFSVE